MNGAKAFLFNSVKDARVNMQLIFDRSSQGYKEKEKIYAELSSTLKTALNKEDNLKALIKTKLESLTTVISNLQEMIKKGLDHKNLLENILEPIKQRITKELRLKLRDQLIIFVELKDLKLLISKGEKTTLEDFKTLKSYLLSFLQEKLQEANDRLNDIKDKASLEYFRYENIKNDLEGKIQKGVDLELLKHL